MLTRCESPFCPSDSRSDGTLSRVCLVAALLRLPLQLWDKFKWVGRGNCQIRDRVRVTPPVRSSPPLKILGDDPSQHAHYLTGSTFRAIIGP